MTSTCLVASEGDSRDGFDARLELHAVVQHFIICFQIKNAVLQKLEPNLNVLCTSS